MAGAQLNAAVHNLKYNSGFDGTAAYDKSVDYDKARALQMLLFGTYNRGTEKGKTYVDGKWGAVSAAKAKQAGMQISKDFNSYTNSKTGETYVWDPTTKNYVTTSKRQSQVITGNPNDQYHPGQVTHPLLGLLGVDVHGLSNDGATPRQRNMSIDLDNLTDLQARDVANLMRQNPNMSQEEAAKMILKMHDQNQNYREAGAVTGSFITSLFPLAIGAGRKPNWQGGRSGASAPRQLPPGKSPKLLPKGNTPKQLPEGQKLLPEGQKMLPEGQKLLPAGNTEPFKWGPLTDFDVAGYNGKEIVITPTAFKCGGNFKKKLCGGKKLQKGDKLTPQQEQQRADSIANNLKNKHPQYTQDQRAERAPIKKDGKTYFMNGDGELVEKGKLKKGSQNSATKHANGGNLETLKAMFDAYKNR